MSSWTEAKFKRSSTQSDMAEMPKAVYISRNVIEIAAASAVIDFDNGHMESKRL